jgi:hypothetical protein
MDTTPQPESAELALLLLPTDPVLPPDRELLLKDRFLSNLTEHDTRARRRLVLRAAAPIALTAAVAATAAVAMLPTSPPTTSSHTTGSSSATASSAEPRVATLPDHISNVAYTLDRTAGDFIKITVHNPGTNPPDAAQLQQDLARMGVNATVSKLRPHCTPQLYNLAERDGNGDYVATVPREVVAKFPETIIFSPDLAADPDPATLTVSIGTKPGEEPTCAPAPPLP